VARPTDESIAWGAAAGVLALATAGVGHWSGRLSSGVLGLTRRALGPPVAGVKAIHSGIVGDYATWIAVVGAVWMLTLR
jgi:hypothetical protein